MVAVAIHGYPRFTKDVDLLILEHDLEHVLENVRPLGFTLPAAPLVFDARTPWERRVQKVSKVQDGELLTLDLILVSPSLDTVWEDRDVFEWQGQPIRVVSLSGLELMKRLAGRTQDQLDLEMLGLMPRGGEGGRGD